MAEPARKLETLPPETSERTTRALGQVIDLEAARQKQRMQNLRRSAPVRNPPLAEAQRTSAPVISLEEGRAKRNTAEKASLRAPPQSARGRPGPMPVRTPLQMSSQLGAAQTRDRMAETSPDAAPYATDEPVFGEFKPQKDMTEAETERERQRVMMRTREQFTTPEEAEDEEESMQEEAPEEPPSEDLGRYQRFQRQTQISRRSAQMKVAQTQVAAGEAMTQAEQVKRGAQTFQRLINYGVKIFSAAGGAVILPLLWLVFTLNVETINILIFRVDLPMSVNSLLNCIGMNISVDRKKVFTVGNMTIVAITLFIDLLLFFALLPTLIFGFIMAVLVAWGIANALGFLGI